MSEAVVTVVSPVRAIGDRELLRRCPGWFAVMFHYCRLRDDGIYEVCYSVQMAEGSEPFVARIELWRSAYLDGSAAWVPVGVL